MKIRYHVFRDAFKTATVLNGLEAVAIEGKLLTRYEHCVGKIPSFAKHLRTWGEVGTVKVKTATTAKLADKGVQCMSIGYVTNHGGDVYRMWNPITNRVHNIRDVIWLKRMYFKPQDVANEDEVDVDEIIVEQKQSTGQVNGTENLTSEESLDSEERSIESEEESPMPITTTRSGRTVQPPPCLIEEMGGVQITNQVAGIGAGIGGGFENTNELRVMTYQEAMNTQDRDKWTKAVEEEHDRMIKNKVWKPVDWDSVPKDAKIIDSTWVMKKKSNDTYRARMNARGFKQVEGQHFDGTSLAAPVTNVASIRIMFTLMLMAGWTAYIVDVKSAFLHGDFEDGEKIHMEVPNGFENYYAANIVLLLLQTLYGLKQAAIAFCKKLLLAMKMMGFKRSEADPCIYFRWSKKNGLIVWLSRIDDCLCIGNIHEVKIAKNGMLKQFECDDVGFPTEYVGCKLNFNKEENSLTFTQPVMIQSFSDEHETKECSNDSVTPMEPGRILVSGNECDLVSKVRQTYYRSGV